mmetsp:Transcript_25965/g.54846  ORF Transcript_25965/g.54846 Transcript_25965/m.54846 type:complete len:81 (+) Transcript_25965:1144-1386(+)
MGPRDGARLQVNCLDELASNVESDGTTTSTPPSPKLPGANPKIASSFNANRTAQATSGPTLLNAYQEGRTMPSKTIGTRR